MRQDFRALKSRKFPTHLQKVSKKLDSKNFYRVFRKILRRVGNHVVQKNQKKLQRRRFWPRRFYFLECNTFSAVGRCVGKASEQTLLRGTLLLSKALPCQKALRRQSLFFCVSTALPSTGCNEQTACAPFSFSQKRRAGCHIRMAFPAFVILLFSHGFFLCGQSALRPVFSKNWMNRPSSRPTLLRKTLSAS